MVRRPAPSSSWKKVVRMADRESGLSARTIARRLSSVSGFYVYVIARGDTVVSANPVPRGLSTRRSGGRSTTVPLVRVPRTLPTTTASVYMRRPTEHPSAGEAMGVEESGRRCTRLAPQPRQGAQTGSRCHHRRWR